MKKLVLTLTSLLLGIGLFAQGPTTTWPYLFPSFEDAVVQLKDKAAATQKVNIHVYKGALHYLDPNGVIREALMLEVMSVEVGADKYVNKDGTLVKVLAENEAGCVAEELLGDIEVPKKQHAARNPMIDNRAQSGAFEITAQQQAAVKVSVFDLANTVGSSEKSVKSVSDRGREIEMVKKNYVIVGTTYVVATKKGLSDWLPQDRQADWKDWQKDNKVKWNDPQSLLSIASFIAGK